MKRTSVLCALFMTLWLTSANAQKFYIDISSGYGFSTNSQTLSLYNYNTTSTSTLTSASYTTSQEQIYISLGKGINFGTAVGYMLNRNVGAEVRLSYQIGAKYESNQQSSNFYSSGSASSSYVNLNTSSLQANMLQINPSIVLTPDYTKKFNPYAKFGIMISYGTIKYNQTQQINGTTNYQQNQKLNGGSAFGITAGIGALYSLNRKLSLFTELLTVSSSYAPRKGEITKYISNGQDQTNTIPVSQKKTIYVDHSTQGSQISETEPKIALRQSYPLSNIAFNIGLRFHF